MIQLIIFTAPDAVLFQLQLEDSLKYGPELIMLTIVMRVGLESLILKL